MADLTAPGDAYESEALDLQMQSTREFLQGQVPQAEQLPIIDRIIELYDKALRAGLPLDKEIYCRVFLAVALYDRAVALDEDELDALIKGGRNAAPAASRALAAFEQALALDATTGMSFFGARLNRSAYLPRLGILWGTEGDYVKARRGVDATISYLEGKLNTLAPLGAPQFPDLCLTLGCLYGEAGNDGAAATWFRRALAVEDLLPGSGSAVKFYAEAKKKARDNLDIAERRESGVDTSLRAAAPPVKAGGSPTAGDSPTVRGSKGILIALVVVGSLLLLSGSAGMGTLTLLAAAGYWWWRKSQ